MDKKLVGLLGAGVLVMAATAWLYGSTKVPKPDAGDVRFLHCVNCLREVPYTDKAEEEGCRRCGGRDFPLVATKDSIKETGARPSVFARMLPALLVELCLLLGAVLAYLTYFSARASREPQYLYTECGKCEQRLRYDANKAGRAGICPRCRRGLVFPTAAPEKPTRPWWKIWGPA